jgi:hypothetical protein
MCRAKHQRKLEKNDKADLLTPEEMKKNIWSHL